MTENYYEEYELSLATVERAISDIDSDNVGIVEVNCIDSEQAPAERLEADLDGWDIVFCLASAAASAFLTTNEDFGKWLAEVHDAASGASGDYDFLQKALSKLFEHKGDYMDIMTTRTDDDAWRLFHRLFYGHDPLSAFQEVNDNPFFLMVNQRGFAGVLQAVRHLMADTFSKQGLPIPGHSHLDYTSENGRPWNYLIDLVQELSTEAYGDKRHAEPIYERLLTVRAQDVAGGTMVTALASSYLEVRGIEDDIRKAQVKLVAYTMSFFAEAIVGAARQNGVPYVNAPLGLAMAKEYAGLLTSSNRRTSNLECRTTELEAQSAKLVGYHDRLKALLAEDGIGGYMEGAYDE